MPSSATHGQNASRVRGTTFGRTLGEPQQVENASEEKQNKLRSAYLMEVVAATSVLTQRFEIHRLQ
jgi:hypothetical protein